MVARATGWAAVVVLGAGCLPEDPTGQDEPNALLGGGVDDELDAMAILDPDVYEKIGNCLESLQFSVYVGDPEWQRVYDEVGRTAAGLRGICEDLAINDPAALEEIHTEWVNFEIATGARAPESTAPPPTNPPRETVPPPVTWSPDGCHPSYTPCVPIAPDVDCKGPGDGPVYVEGPIQIIGYDEYNIDDGDGIACEPE